MNRKVHLPVVQPNGEVTAAGIPTQPPAGSWAETARMMAQMFPDSDTDWDAWKDEMKETDGQGY